MKDREELQKILADKPITVALFEVVKVTPLYETSSDDLWMKENMPKGRKVNPRLNIGDEVYFEKDTEYCRHAKTHETIWHRWEYHMFDFIGYTTITREKLNDKS